MRLKNKPRGSGIGAGIAIGVGIGAAMGNLGAGMITSQGNLPTENAKRDQTD